jgi:hypothetical protein
MIPESLQGTNKWALITGDCAKTGQLGARADIEQAVAHGRCIKRASSRAVLRRFYAAASKATRAIGCIFDRRYGLGKE